MGHTFSQVSYPALLAYLMICTACAAVRPVAPVLAAPAADVAACITQAQRATVTAQAMRADVRLLSFGPEGRLRSRAEIAVARPDKVRLTLLGPHGGPLGVLVCDGDTVQRLDLAAARLLQGPATAEAFDALMAPLQAHMGAAEWVRLFFGELVVPDTAAFAGPGPAGLYTLHWSVPDGRRIWAAFAATDGRLQALKLCRDADVLLAVDVARRTAEGIPSALHMRHRAAAGMAFSQVEVSVRSVEVDPSLDKGTFALSAPPGIAVETLH